MSADPVSTTLAIHGPVCLAALLGIWKLGGESKFGTEKVADLQTLRPKLLTSMVRSLEATLSPVLVYPSENLEVELDDYGRTRTTPPRFSVTGKEALTNAVRDFVKSSSQALLDLREANQLDDRLNRSLDQLRKVVILIFITTLLVCGLMGAGKLEWISVASAWIHNLSFAVLVLLVVLVAFLFWRILTASSRVDRLKSSYVDLY